jgi:hypothetical protein
MSRADLPGPRAESVTADGADDGFVVLPGWMAEGTPSGETRLLVSVPLADLPRVHAALVGVLSEPLGFLYRRKIDRRNPGPRDAPPTDFVALALARDRVLEALSAAALLVYCDARGEVWIRGRLGEQVVLDEDGLLYCYPDDPSFRDALAAVGVPAEDVPTLARRDYVKHWFRAEADPAEDALVDSLRLTPVRARAEE